MRLVLDAARCQGHGRCYDLAPEVFDEDAEGYGRLRGDGVVPERSRREAGLAVRNCPENALAVLQDQLPRQQQGADA